MVVEEESAGGLLRGRTCRAYGAVRRRNQQRMPGLAERAGGDFYTLGVLVFRVAGVRAPQVPEASRSFISRP